ncbi:MAG: DNA polymerase III subunit alpha [Candidatus Harrisonbacteria bacterium]|nr:DNA polymerase III subunit alpha [Candidatus Harrisonbacteria bacterium]
MPRFVHLHTHSHYSLLDGLGKIDDLVNRAKKLGMDSVALTDHGNLYGAVEFYKKAKKAGIKPILGIETYVAPRDHKQKEINGGEEKYYHLILLAKNERGWKNLIKLVTIAHLEGFYYKPRVDKNLLQQYHEGLIALSACITGEVAKNILNNNAAGAEKAALEYQKIFGPENFYLEIGHHPGIKETIKANEGLKKLSQKTGIPLVATQDIHYVKPSDAEYHDILLAVQTGNKLSDKSRLTLKDDDFSMRSPEEMAGFFQDVPEAIENTVRIANQCNFELQLGKTQLPKFNLPENQTANGYLRSLITERTPLRYPEITPEIKNRIDYEIGVIEKTGFADYFLIVQDFINWAKDHGIVVGPGRGSAAGSIIAYILNITDIDPLKYDLLFERFLNPDRIQMPDIDIDFADTRRDEVFGYLEEKYGKDRVAHIITFGTMAARAAIRDAGRAMGLSYGFCDQIAKLIPFNPTQGMKEGWLDHCLKEVNELKNLYQNNPDAKKVIDAAKNLEGVVRHASVHACGTVIAKEPLTEYMPIQYAPQGDNTIITQFEMHSVEDLGLLKMDLLGLKNLTIIEDTLRLIEEGSGVKIDIGQIPLDDKKTFELLQAADTTGVFQLESSGMRRYLKELRPNELEDIIAMVALYRPGPMDLIPQYIKRKFGKERITYLHPKLEPILKKTYGVAIYQEQLMQIARDLAGFTLAEADTLRKAVGKKIKSLLDEQAQKMVNGMIANGIAKNVAEQIWQWFEPFARYGFNRSHAACYAMIAYRTAYLRARYPIEFYTSLFNNEAGDVERIAFLISEAKKADIAVLPPDINKSLANFTPEESGIRFGLLAIKNVGQNIVEAIVAERQKGGPFKNLVDLLQRVEHKDLNKKSFESLLKCGALDDLGIERNAGLTNMEEIINFAGTLRKSKKTSQFSLFGQTHVSANALKLKSCPPATQQEKLTWEKELLGLYISDHPLNRHKEVMSEYGVQEIKNLLLTNSSAGERKSRIAGIIAKVQKINTKLGQPMVFAKVEDLSNTMEVIVFSDTLARTLPMWRENNIVMVSGKMSWRNGEPKFICDNVREL